MQIKPEFGSLPCLLTHFRVTIRVLLITHKDPGKSYITDLLPRRSAAKVLDARKHVQVHDKSRRLTEQLTLAPRSIHVLSTIYYSSGSTPFTLDKMLY